MGIDWDANLLAPLFEQFGEPVNYRPKSGNAYDITGIFDRAYAQQVESLEGADINTTNPILGIRDSEFTVLPKKGDKVYIYRIDSLFIVSSVEPDSHGGSKLVLNKVSV